MYDLLARWHYSWHLLTNAQERKTFFLATLNTLKRLVIGHTASFSLSLTILIVSYVAAFYGTFSFMSLPAIELVYSWKAWACALAATIGTCIFRLVSYYELLYMRASLERKDNEYTHRYFWGKQAFLWFVPLMLTCADLFDLILRGPFITMVPPFFFSVTLSTILWSFFLLWALDFYRGRQWISRSFKSAFRLVLIFAPLLMLFALVEWLVMLPFSFLLAEQLSETSSFMMVLLWGITRSLFFFIATSIANTLYLKGKHAYSEDFFTT